MDLIGEMDIGELTVLLLAAILILVIGLWWGDR